MSRNIATMADEEVFAVLDKYAESVHVGVIDFDNKLEMPMDELVFLSVALEYVNQTNSEKMSGYFDLLKNVEGEIINRTGQTA